MISNDECKVVNDSGKGERLALANMLQTYVGNLSSAHRSVDSSDPVPVCVNR